MRLSVIALLLSAAVCLFAPAYVEAQVGYRGHNSGVKHGYGYNYGYRQAYTYYQPYVYQPYVYQPYYGYPQQLVAPIPVPAPVIQNLEKPAALTEKPAFTPEEIAKLRELLKDK